MTDFEHALVLALNKCRRDGVKPIARNVKTRLEGGFAFYAERTIKLRLQEMYQDGLLKKAKDNHPRSGFIPRYHHICPTCHQPVVEQLQLPLNYAV
jgi:hypothetical protein